mgnify:FL=1
MKKTELVTFDSVKAARNRDMQIALLKTAKEDGSAKGIAHALAVISAANRINNTTRKKL